MKFQRHYKSEDGTSSIWHFDTNHSEYNPIMVEELDGDELQAVLSRLVHSLTLMKKEL